MKEEGQNIKAGLAVFRGPGSAAVSCSFLQIRRGSSRPEWEAEIKSEFTGLRGVLYRVRIKTANQGWVQEGGVNNNNSYAAEFVQTR